MLHQKSKGKVFFQRYKGSFIDFWVCLSPKDWSVFVPLEDPFGYIFTAVLLKWRVRGDVGDNQKHLKGFLMGRRRIEGRQSNKERWATLKDLEPICQAQPQAFCSLQLCHVSLTQDACPIATVVFQWSLPLSVWELPWLSLWDYFYFFGFYFVFQMTWKKFRVLSFTFTSQSTLDIYYQYLFLYYSREENGCSHTEVIEEIPTTLYCHIR